MITENCFPTNYTVHMGNLIGGGHTASGQQGGQHSSARREADELFRLRKQLAIESQEAYRKGDGAKAKQLSSQAKLVQRKAEAAQARAAEEVFRGTNADRRDGMIDLHGLYVGEAESVAER